MQVLLEGYSPKPRNTSATKMACMQTKRVNPSTPRDVCTYSVASSHLRRAPRLALKGLCAIPSDPSSSLPMHRKMHESDSKWVSGRVKVARERDLIIIPWPIIFPHLSLSVSASQITSHWKAILLISLLYNSRRHST